MIRITEQESKYHDIDQMSVLEILKGINEEDKLVPLAVAEAIPQIEKLASAVAERMSKGEGYFISGQEQADAWV